MDKETRAEIDSLVNALNKLKQENEDRDKAQIDHNRSVSESLSEITKILKGDETEENPGIIKTFKWLQTLKLYARVSWVVLAFIVGLMWGLFEFITYVREHWIIKLHWVVNTIRFF